MMPVRDRRKSGSNAAAQTPTASAGDVEDGTQKVSRPQHATMGVPRILLMALAIIGCVSLVPTVRPSPQLRKAVTGLAQNQEPTLTAVMIHSSWNPAQPSTTKIQNAIRSVRHNAIGLEESSPIFLVVNDRHLQEFSNSTNGGMVFWKDGDKSAENEEINSNDNDNNSNLNSSSNHIHIAGSTKVLETIHRQHPTVKYLYHVNEDLIFSIPIDHLGLIRTMEEPFEHVKSDINYVLFSQGISEDSWFVRRSCLQSGVNSATRTTDETNIRRVPVRKSHNNKVVKHMIVSSGLGAEDNLALMCESCNYRPTETTYLVRFDWYHQLVESLKSSTKEKDDHAGVFPTDDVLVSEVHKQCKLHEEQEETTGLYMYFDNRLYFGNHILKNVADGP